MINLTLNDNISFYRKQQNMTQEELAKELGVTNQSVSKWESAQCCPDISLIPKLANIFDVSIDELFGKATRGNDIFAQFPLRDDDTFRVVVVKGKRILSTENLDKTITITFPKNCNETTKPYFKVEVFGNICSDANINGDVISHGDIECNQINGDIKSCEGNISCQGRIDGTASCKNNISCGDSINGAASCGNNISCGDSVNGPVSCGNNVTCGDGISGDVSCGGDIRCKTIEGNVECEGNIIYK